jgi:putative ABC transport system permease protein
MTQFLEILWKDLQYSLRALRKHPTFAATVVITLAVGIGANTTTFSAINAVLIEPLPFKEPDRLVRLWESNPGRGWPQYPISAPNFVDWRKQQLVFEELAGMELVTFNLTGSSEPQRLAAASISANFFPTVGVAPVLGRNFLPEEENTGRNRVAILSYPLWQQQFGGDKAVLDKTIQLDGQNYSVIGVMPAAVQFPWSRDLWVPLVLDPVKEPWRADRANHNLMAYGRIKPGLSLDQAIAGMNVVTRDLEQQYPKSNKGWSVLVRTFPDWIVPRTVRQSMLALWGAVGLVLLIACVNVAGMLLTRAKTKSRQTAICLALGASRARVMQQLLAESLVLALLGGLLGVVLAFWGTRFIAANPQRIARLNETRIDGHVLGFALLLSIITGLLFGLAPAWLGAWSTLMERLKEGNQGDGGRTTNRFGGALVVAEITLALVLLATAGLMARSFVHLQRIPLGFVPDNVLTMQISLPTTKYGAREQRVNFFDQLLERIRNMPGVMDAAAITQPPSSGGSWSVELAFEGNENDVHGVPMSADARAATTHYFHTMGVPLLQGRDFNEQDNGGPDQPLNLIISESFARRYWPNENPIGKRFRPGANNPFGTVVGVVGDVRNNNLHEDVEPAFYFPYGYIGMQGLFVVVHSAAQPEGLAPALRAQVHAINSDQPVYNILTMREIVSGVSAQPRFQTVLLGLFSLIALLLATVGIYGIMAYLVRQRTREIGVRMALGAKRRDILIMVIKHGMRHVLLGIVLGTAGCLALARWLKSAFFGMSHADPFTFVVVALFLMAVAFLPCYFPARYATKIDPSTALRVE